jgi:ComF family protein
MSSIGSSVISILSTTALPFPCPLCDDELPVAGPNLLCDSCLKKLRPFCSPTCPGCGGIMDGVLEFCSLCMREDPRLWVGAIALFPLTGSARQLIHRFKYRNTPEISRSVGALGTQRLTQSGLTPDIIVPTPLHWTRKLQRGFNQAELFSRMLSHFSGVPVETALRRVKRTHQQAKLNREQRKKNLSGAFSVKKGANFKKRDILLVDDVMTTGATLHSAAAELAANGAGRIYIMVIARRM